jgi:hypothetical protein
MKTRFSLLGYLPLLVIRLATTCIDWSSLSSFRLEARGLRILAVDSGWTSTNMKFFEIGWGGNISKKK